MAWVLDLDGVLWRGDQGLAGAAGAVARLQASGESVAFVTNNALVTLAELRAKLGAHGIDPGPHVISSATAAAHLVEEGERVLVCGGAGAEEAVRSRGAEVVDPSEVGLGELDGLGLDAVLVGNHFHFDYHRMAVAAAAARAGARLLATNDDSTYPTERGLLPGAGAIVAAVERASGSQAVVAGKPHPTIAAEVRARLGGEGIAVGDRADTDGRFAVALGYRFALVLSGVTSRADLPVDPPPDLVADDLASLVDAVLGEG